MKKLRFWIIILSGWLILFFSIERVAIYQVDTNLIRSDTYVFVTVIGLIALLFPKLNGVVFSAVLIGITGLFIGIWYLDPRWEVDVVQRYPHLNSTMLLIVLQISAIIITGLLARQIAIGMTEFEQVIGNITLSRIGLKAPSFAEEQKELYREIRRAGRYNRPLVVMAMKVDKASFKTALPQVVKDAQQAMIEEIAMSGIARILDEAMLDFDTIAVWDNCFLAVLPETTPENVAYIAQRLAKVVKEKMNVQLDIGAASYPTESLTFDGLVEIAMENANQRPISGQVNLPQQPIATQEA